MIIPCQLFSLLVLSKGIRLHGSNLLLYGLYKKYEVKDSNLQQCYEVKFIGDLSTRIVYRTKQ